MRVKERLSGGLGSPQQHGRHDIFRIQIEIQRFESEGIYYITSVKLEHKGKDIQAPILITRFWQ